MKQKIGLLVEGGGMKCAYASGVLDFFLDRGITFDYAIGVSAGAANAASFLAGQRDRNRRFYVDYVKDPRYISIRSFLKTGNYFGLQFIYGDMTNEGGGDPLDYQALMANPADLVFPATDAATGLPHYFHKADCGPEDYRPIMATCALPVVSKPIAINGHLYFDGGVSDSIPLRRAMQDGCTKVVALLSKPRGYVMQPQGHRTAYTLALQKKYPKIVTRLNMRHNDYNRALKELLQAEKDGKAFLFTPSGRVKMSTYTRDPAVMQALYDEGYADGKHQIDSLSTFLMD